MLFGKRERVVNRILIVEDEPLTAFDNETMVADAGYEVVATLDRFSDAVETLDREKVDLILCDVRLPGSRRNAAFPSSSRPACRRTMRRSWSSAA